MENKNTDIVRRGPQWNEDRIRQVYELALLGLTEAEMVKPMGVSIDTFTLWKQEKEGFMEALVAGRDLADSKVAAALYRRATGYTVKEQHVSIFKGVAVVTEVEREIPPDAWAANKWLSLRQRSRWSESQRVEITNTNININKFDFEGLSDAELLVLKKVGLLQLARDAGRG